MKKIIKVCVVVILCSKAFALDNLPEWVSDVNTTCPKNKICVVGSGDTLELAQANARKNISKYFETKIDAKFISSISSDENNVEQYSSSEVQETTQNKLKGVEISKTYFDGSEFYALATLDKILVIKDIKNNIDKIDSQMEILMNKANCNVNQLEELYKAREELNNQYLLLSGGIIPEKISYKQILDKKNQNTELSFYIETNTDFEKEIGNFLSNLLISNGFSVANNEKTADRIINIDITKQNIKINVKGFIKEEYFINIKNIDTQNYYTKAIVYDEFIETGRSESQIQDIMKAKIQYFIDQNLNKILE